VTTLYFVRHAESEGNEYRICQGQYDGSLSRRGSEQLHALRRRFSGQWPDAVVSATRWRARATAHAISGMQCPVYLEPGLNEIDFGTLEGLSWGDVARQEPALYQAFFRPCADISLPGGEHLHQAAQRVDAAVRRITQQFPGKRVAVSSHGGAIELFLALHSSEGLGQFCLANSPHNTGITTVTALDDGRFRVEAYDDYSHLTGSLLPSPNSAPKQPVLSFRQADYGRDRIYMRDCGEDAWHTVFGMRSRFSSEDFLAMIRSIMELDSRTVFIPELDRIAAGLLVLDPRQQDQPCDGHISLLYLRQAFRGKGLGVQLIGKAAMEYRQKGRTRLRLHVAATNRPALHLYERCGFVRLPRLGNAFSRQIVMHKDISVPAIEPDARWL